MIRADGYANAPDPSSSNSDQDSGPSRDPTVFTCSCMNLWPGCNPWKEHLLGGLSGPRSRNHCHCGPRNRTHDRPGGGGPARWRSPPAVLVPAWVVWTCRGESESEKNSMMTTNNSEIYNLNQTINYSQLLWFWIIHLVISDQSFILPLNPPLNFFVLFLSIDPLIVEYFIPWVPKYFRSFNYFQSFSCLSSILLPGLSDCLFYLSKFRCFEIVNIRTVDTIISGLSP